MENGKWKIIFFHFRNSGKKGKKIEWKEVKKKKFQKNISFTKL